MHKLKIKTNKIGLNNKFHIVQVVPYVWYMAIATFPAGVVGIYIYYIMCVYFLLLSWNNDGN